MFTRKMTTSNRFEALNPRKVSSNVSVREGAASAASAALESNLIPDGAKFGRTVSQKKMVITAYSPATKVALVKKVSQSDKDTKDLQPTVSKSVQRDSEVVPSDSKGVTNSVCEAPKFPSARLKLLLGKQKKERGVITIGKKCKPQYNVAREVEIDENEAKVNSEIVKRLRDSIKKREKVDFSEIKKIAMNSVLGQQETTTKPSNDLASKSHQESSQQQESNNRGNERYSNYSREYVGRQNAGHYNDSYKKKYRKINEEKGKSGVEHFAPEFSASNYSQESCQTFDKNLERGPNRVDDKSRSFMKNDLKFDMYSTRPNSKHPSSSRTADSTRNVSTVPESIKAAASLPDPTPAAEKPTARCSIMTTNIYTRSRKEGTTKKQFTPRTKNNNTGIKRDVHEYDIDLVFKTGRIFGKNVANGLESKTINKNLSTGKYNKKLVMRFLIPIKDRQDNARNRGRPVEEIPDEKTTQDILCSRKQNLRARDPKDIADEEREKKKEQAREEKKSKKMRRKRRKSWKENDSGLLLTRFRDPSYRELPAKNGLEMKKYCQRRKQRADMADFFDESLDALKDVDPWTCTRKVVLSGYRNVLYDMTRSKPRDSVVNKHLDLLKSRLLASVNDVDKEDAEIMKDQKATKFADIKSVINDLVERGCEELSPPKPGLIVDGKNGEEVKIVERHKINLNDRKSRDIIKEQWALGERKSEIIDLLTEEMYPSNDIVDKKSQIQYRSIPTPKWEKTKDQKPYATREVAHKFPKKSVFFPPREFMMLSFLEYSLEYRRKLIRGCVDDLTSLAITKEEVDRCDDDDDGESDGMSPDFIYGTISSLLDIGVEHDGGWFTIATEKFFSLKEGTRFFENKIFESLVKKIELTHMKDNKIEYTYSSIEEFSKDQERLMNSIEKSIDNAVPHKYKKLREKFQFTRKNKVRNNANADYLAELNSLGEFYNEYLKSKKETNKEAKKKTKKKNVEVDEFEDDSLSADYRPIEISNSEEAGRYFDDVDDDEIVDLVVYTDEGDSNSYLDLKSFNYRGTKVDSDTYFTVVKSVEQVEREVPSDDDEVEIKNTRRRTFTPEGPSIMAIPPPTIYSTSGSSSFVPRKKIAADNDEADSCLRDDEKKSMQKADERDFKNELKNQKRFNQSTSVRPKNDDKARSIKKQKPGGRRKREEY